MTETDQIETHIEKTRQGDLGAFTEVVRLTQDRLRAYILWYCPAANAVDDIAQEVYIYAYRNLDRYQPGTSLMAWLKTIAHFRALNCARSASARAQREERYFDEFMFDAAAQSEAPEWQDNRMGVLRKCLEQLPEKSLELIRHRYEKNLDANSLATLTKKSSSAIRVTLLRIREQLRHCVRARISREGVVS